MGENAIFFDLVDRLKLDGKPVSNPAVAACEAAAIAVAMSGELDDARGTGSVGPQTIGLVAAGHMPRSTYQFDQGVAAGIAMMLVTEKKTNTSRAALMKRFGLSLDLAKSTAGYAIDVASRALSAAATRGEDFDMEKHVGQAMNELGDEDDNFLNGMRYDSDFMNSLSGIATGITMALSTEGRG